MPLCFGFASSTAHNLPKPRTRSRSDNIFRLAPLSVPGAAHGTSTFSDAAKADTRDSLITSSSWNSRFLCAMTSPSAAASSSRTAPLSPPAPSSINAYPTRRSINPGVYICKGEGHSVRHSWIVDGRLVEFPFPETTTTPSQSQHHHHHHHLHHGQQQHTDEQQSKQHLEEGTRPPIPISGGASRRRPSEHSIASAGSSHSSRWF